MFSIATPVQMLAIQPEPGESLRSESSFSSEREQPDISRGVAKFPT